jgi:hypothetical protein
MNKIFYTIAVTLAMITYDIVINTNEIQASENITILPDEYEIGNTTLPIFGAESSFSYTSFGYYPFWNLTIRNIELKEVSIDILGLTRKNDYAKEINNKPSKSETDRFQNMTLQQD